MSSRAPTVPSSSASPLSSASLSPGPSVASTEAVLISVDSVLEAELVRGRLESAGIAARLSDTHTAGLGSHLTAVIGGVRVVVDRADIEAGLAILNAELDADDIDHDDADDDDALAPGAGKADIAARWAFLSALLGVVVPVGGQIGSLFLLWRAWAVDDVLTQRGKTTVGAAVAIDIASTMVWGALLL